MAIGEAPGKEEAYRGRPFVGPSGKDQKMYLKPFGINPNAEWYLTNVVKEYHEDNPDPTPERIEAWSGYLEQEIAAVRPDLVVAVGRFATDWLLGHQVDMDRVHGVPFPNVERANGATVIPVFHPAAGLHQPRYKPFLQWDYHQVANAIWDLETGDYPPDRILVTDTWNGHEDYQDVDGYQLAELVHDRLVHSQYALDTEGTPDSPWSIQVSSYVGHGYTLRVGCPGFHIGIAALQHVSDQHDAQVIVHNGLYDIPMARAMGLELAHVSTWDTMYAAYLLGFEAQGLKPLAWRFCGMDMKSFKQMVSGAGKEKQLNYIQQADSMAWTVPEKRTVRTNNGVTKDYKPAGMARKLKSILKKVEAEGVENVDLLDRWYSAGGEQYAKDAAREARQEVEQVLGPFPEPTLGDIPLSDAVWYASRDADAALRLKPCLERELSRYDLLHLMARGMASFPAAEEIQATGMPASRPYFENLQADMMNRARDVQDMIIRDFTEPVLKDIKYRVPYKHITKQGKVKMKYKTEVKQELVYEGFNPASPKQVAEMLERRGLSGLRTTKKTGKPSTDAKSIGHLAKDDAFVAAIFEYRKYRKIATDFCTPVLDRIPAGTTHPYFVHSKWMITRTTSRRLATTGKTDARKSGFNLMNIPIRTELGKLVRQGYMCPDGYSFGSWDYSKIEPRCLAHLSGDPLLMEIFLEDRNIYKETASRVWGIALEDISDEQYAVAKAVVLGSMYGMGAATLQAGLWEQGLMDWTMQDCEQLLDDFWDVFSGAAEYKRRVANEARECGYVRDHWGHYRWLPDLNSWDGKLRAEAERHAVSHKVQPFAQGMLQNGLAHLWWQLQALRSAGHDVRMCLNMHDEVVLIYKKAEGLASALDGIVTDSLVNHCGVRLNVPVVAEGVHAETWSKLK
jgi:uracil-DNA glycosylase family 4